MSNAKKPSKQDTARPRARAKAGLKGLSSENRLAVSLGYLEAHPQSPVAAEVQVEATTLQTKRDAVLSVRAERTRARNLVEILDGAVAVADQEHDQAAADYANAVARKSKGDPAILKASAVAQASARRKHKAVPDKVEHVTTERGAEPGELDVEFERPEGAVSFAIQYRRESAPPTTPWLPEDGPILTRKPRCTIQGLPVNEEIRVRVQAIGDVAGHWSDEAVGRTR